MIHRPKTKVKSSEKKAIRMVGWWRTVLFFSWRLVNAEQGEKRVLEKQQSEQKAGNERKREQKMIQYFVREKG